MKTFFIFLIAVALLYLGYGVILPAINPTWAAPQPAVVVEQGESTTITNNGTTCTFYNGFVECETAP